MTRFHLIQEWQEKKKKKEKIIGVGVGVLLNTPILFV